MRRLSLLAHGAGIVDALVVASWDSAFSEIIALIPVMPASQSSADCAKATGEANASKNAAIILAMNLLVAFCFSLDVWLAMVEHDAIARGPPFWLGGWI